MIARTFAIAIVCGLIGCDNRSSPAAPAAPTSPIASADTSSIDTPADDSFAETFEFVVPLQTGLESSAARWQLNPPVIDGFSDPNRIAYNRVYLQNYEQSFRQALAGPHIDICGIARYEILTDAGLFKGTWDINKRKFGHRFRADHLIAYLQTRASGKRAVLTYVVRNPRFARHLHDLHRQGVASFWESDVCSVIELLGGAKVLDALPCLMELLNDDNDLIRSEASEAIVEIALGHPTIPPETFESVLQDWIGPPFEGDGSQTAADILARWSKPATARLIKAAQSAHVRWRLSAARALGQIDGPNDEVLGVLSQLLFDADPDVREIAIGSIGSLKSRARDAESVLRAILGNDPHLREAVVSALIEIGASSPEEWDANGNPVAAEQTQTTELPRRPGRIFPAKSPPRPASNTR